MLKQPLHTIYQLEGSDAHILYVVFPVQDHGPVRLSGSGHWQVCARVFQRHFSHHHVWGAAQRGPHPQAVHRHLPGPRDGGARPGGGHVRKTHLPLPLSRDYDQVDQRENSVNHSEWGRGRQPVRLSQRCSDTSRSLIQRNGVVAPSVWAAVFQSSHLLREHKSSEDLQLRSGGSSTQRGATNWCFLPFTYLHLRTFAGAVFITQTWLSLTSGGQNKVRPKKKQNNLGLEKKCSPS